MGSIRNDMDAEAHPNPAATGDDWSFVRWLLAATAVFLLAVAGFNAWTDPTGALGTGRIDPMAELPRDRAAKATLLAHADHPDIVVLGSSRSKRLDFDRPGATRAINAAVVGSDLLEARVFTRWLQEHAGSSAAFPHVVVGIDVEQFRSSSLRSTGMLGVHALARVARAEGGSAEHLPPSELGDLLLSWKVTRESVDALRSHAQRSSTAEAASRDRESVTLTRSADEFLPNGILRSDARLDTPTGRAKLARDLPAEMHAALAEYEERYASIGGDLDDAAVNDFRAMVRAADASGDVPTVFLTPMHPAVARALGRAGRTERHAAVVRLLRAAAARGEISFIDCTTCLPGAARYWTDGIHPSPLGARVLTRRLRAHMLLPNMPGDSK